MFDHFYCRCHSEKCDGAITDHSVVSVTPDLVTITIKCKECKQQSKK